MIPLRDNVPSRRPPIIVLLLIAANAVVFLRELSLPPQQLEKLFLLWGMVPRRLTDPAWARQVGFPDGPVPAAATFFTSMFLHGGWLHVIGNMWWLWLFGDNVEDRLGHLPFLGFYLICGLGAGGLHFVVYRHSALPTIGASGAVAGVMGAYLLLYPRARILTLVPIFFLITFIEIPAVIVLGFWFFIQLNNGVAALSRPEAFSGVAFWAHVGGFLAGMALLAVFPHSGTKGRR